MTDVVLTVASLWLGSLLAYSGSMKFLTPLEHRARTVRGYDLGPAVASGIIARALPYLELACGAVILLTPYPRLGTLATLALGVIFGVATGSALARGLNIECGCGGRGSDRVRPSSLARAVLMAMAALAAALVGVHIPNGIGWAVFGLALVPAALVGVRRVRSRITPTSHHLHDHHAVRAAQ
jgi:hypothetical protein